MCHFQREVKGHGVVVEGAEVLDEVQVPGKD